MIPGNRSDVSEPLVIEMNDPNEATTATPQSRYQLHQFACLFTKHKTQKRKVWQDGRLVLSQGLRAVLYDANPPLGSSDASLDQCELTQPQFESIVNKENVGCELDMEKYFVSVEGPWIQKSAQSEAPRNQRSNPEPSKGMKKLLTKKFQVPAKKPPNPPTRQPNDIVFLRRKRPLQPGELQRQFYGVAADSDRRNPAVSTHYSMPHGPDSHLQSSWDRPMANLTQQHALLYPEQRTSSLSTDATRGLTSFYRRERPDAFADGQHAPSVHQTSLNEASIMPFNQPVLPNSLLELSTPQQTNQALLSSRRTKPETSLFSANGFDPSSFYGEDDFDDDDEPNQSFIKNSSTESESQPSPFRLPYEEEPVLNGWQLEMNSQPNSSHTKIEQEDGLDTHTRVLTDTASRLESGVPAVTDDELLALLGAAPARKVGDDFCLPDHGDSSSSSDEDS